MTVLRSGSATDVGRVRTVNQDMPLERPNLYAVADGMGGHVGGEVAARVAVETLAQAFEQAPTLDGSARRRSPRPTPPSGARARSTPTCVAWGRRSPPWRSWADRDGSDVLALANVGDSRAYVYSDGELVQVTADHSLAEERMRHGEMTEAEAAVHPQRHILTRALGVSSEVEADMWELGLRSGDRVLLCSDGLSNEVEHDEMAESWARSRTRRGSATGSSRWRTSTEAPTTSPWSSSTSKSARAVTAPSRRSCRWRRGSNDAVGTASAADATPGPRPGWIGRAEPPAHRTAQPPRTEQHSRRHTDGTATGTPNGTATGTPQHSHRTPSPTTCATRRRCCPPGPTTPWRPGRVWLRRRDCAGRVGPRSDEFFLGTASAAPVARSTTRVAPPPGPPTITREGDTAGAAPSAGHPAPGDLPGHRVSAPGGRRSCGCLLPPALVRLRQLAGHGPGRPGRDHPGPTRGCALVPPQGGGSHSAPCQRRATLSAGGARRASRNPRWRRRRPTSRSPSASRPGRPPRPPRARDVTSTTRVPGGRLRRL